MRVVDSGDVELELIGQLGKIVVIHRLVGMRVTADDWRLTGSRVCIAIRTH